MEIIPYKRRYELIYTVRPRLTVFQYCAVRNTIRLDIPKLESRMILLLWYLHAVLWCGHSSTNTCLLGHSWFICDRSSMLWISLYRMILFWYKFKGKTKCHWCDVLISTTETGICKQHSMTASLKNKRCQMRKALPYHKPNFFTQRFFLLTNVYKIIIKISISNK